MKYLKEIQKSEALVILFHMEFINVDEFNPVSLCHSQVCTAEINLLSYIP